MLKNIRARKWGENLTSHSYPSPHQISQKHIFIFGRRHKSFFWISRWTYNFSFFIMTTGKTFQQVIFFTVKRKIVLQYWSIPAGYWWMMRSWKLPNQWIPSKEDLWPTVKTPIGIMNCKKCHRIPYLTSTLRLNKAKCFLMQLEIKMIFQLLSEKYIPQ